MKTCPVEFCRKHATPMDDGICEMCLREDDQKNQTRRLNHGDENLRLQE